MAGAKPPGEFMWCFKPLRDDWCNLNSAQALLNQIMLLSPIYAASACHVVNDVFVRVVVVGGPAPCCGVEHRGGGSWVCPLPGNEAIWKVHNLFMLLLSHFCPSDRFKAAFPEALSREPEEEAQSNSALQQYSTKQYNQAAIISHPKGKSNIFPSFFSSVSPTILR